MAPARRDRETRAPRETEGTTGMDRYTCAEVLKKLDDYLDRELGPEEVRKVGEHLETCAVCAAEHRFEASVLSEIRTKLRRIEVPRELRQKLSRLLSEPR